jgi:sterol desaturase/sphingolipid hydroxylase (fatty acid hydroxylase superfamily)
MDAKAVAAAAPPHSGAEGTAQPHGRSLLLRGALYPALLLGPLLLLWALLEAGAALSWAPYLAIAVGAPAVLIAERLVPYRMEWQPDRRDLWDDGLFLIAVQVLLPLGLGWLTVLAAQAWLSGAGLTLAIWPTQWPIWAQLLLKVVVGDFFRYWLHRAAHTWPGLWRLHAVHHAPEKLYTTNVFRFHPAEKALQYLCDSAPFILVGVGPELLACYFVFYAMSGLLQHSNCDLRLGWLNYLVSGPEVHRWHHSRTVAESNANYAHSFVLWDLLLGTYFRPLDRSVHALGLLNRAYPRAFWGQLAAPFLKRIRP